MNRRANHLSRRDAEHLLADPAASESVLGTVLSAAGSTARPGELHRENEAVAAFHSARLTPSPTTRSNYVSPTNLGKRAATRAVIATGAIVALASGGFALANSAHMPTLPGQASDQATESVAKTPKPTETTTETTPDSTEPTEPTESTESMESTEPAEGESPTTSPTPTPNFKGLCNAFQAVDRSAHGKSLDSAAFTALAAEAGGVEQIETYCVALIGEPKETGRPTDKPTPGKPTDKPTPSKPTDKPTPGKPTDKPTGKPTPSTVTETPTSTTPGNSGGNGGGKGG